MLNDTRLEVRLDKAIAIGVLGIGFPFSSTALTLTRVSPPSTEIVSNGLSSIVVNRRLAKSGNTSTGFESSTF